MSSEVLLVYPVLSSFVQRDLDILREKFTVEVLQYDRRRRILRLPTLLSRCRIGVGWFALGYAYPMVRLGKFLGKPSVLIAGGYDVEARPEINYGAMLRQPRRWRTTYALSNATKVLAVSQFTLGRVRQWAPRSHAEVLYHGFPEASARNQLCREDCVVTVAEVAPHTWKLKGLDTFVAVAQAFPSVRFVIAGKVHEGAAGLLKHLPPNVHLMGWVEQNSLHRLFLTSKVYAQLSYVESFGCALAEAMARGCFPIATDRGALPEVVGDCGSLLPYGDVTSAVRAIETGLQQGASRAAADRVRKYFPVQARRERLHQLVEEMLARG